MNSDFYKLLKSQTKTKPKTRMDNVVDSSIATAKREIYQHDKEIKRRSKVKELSERAKKHFDKMYEDRVEAIEKNSKKW
tara:strand:+ start:54 stop:290 length:237 start_codon:yes stop_codon:yes gene_type:complete